MAEFDSEKLLKLLPLVKAFVSEFQGEIKGLREEVVKLRETIERVGKQAGTVQKLPDSTGKHLGAVAEGLYELLREKP